MKCSECGKPMVMRKGWHGKFLSCTGFPKCRNTEPISLEYTVVDHGLAHFDANDCTSAERVIEMYDQRIAELVEERNEAIKEIGVWAKKAGELGAKLTSLKDKGTRSDHHVEQLLGKALGYPLFKDDQKNFPGATEADGVFVGEHVAESLAMEASRKIAELEAELAKRSSMEQVREVIKSIERVAYSYCPEQKKDLMCLQLKRAKADIEARLKQEPQSDRALEIGDEVSFLAHGKIVLIKDEKYLISFGQAAHWVEFKPHKPCAHCENLQSDECSKCKHY